MPVCLCVSEMVVCVCVCVSVCVCLVEAQTDVWGPCSVTSVHPASSSVSQSDLSGIGGPVLIL